MPPGCADAVCWRSLDGQDSSGPVFVRVASFLIHSDNHPTSKSSSMFTARLCSLRKHVGTFDKKRPLFHLNRKHGRVTIQFVACSEGGREGHRKTRLTPFRETHAMVRSSFRLRSIAAGFFVSRFAVTDAASAAGVPWRWKAIARQLSLSWTHSRHSKRVRVSSALVSCHHTREAGKGKQRRDRVSWCIVVAFRWYCLVSEKSGGESGRMPNFLLLSSQTTALHVCGNRSSPRLSQLTC